jgi:C1A family cysteine protease
MIKALIVAVFAAAAVSALTVDSSNVETVFKFTNWMTQFNKAYKSESEFDHAFHNFVASLARIAKRNTHNGKTQWGLTKFSDLSAAEFKKYYLTAKMPTHHHSNATVGTHRRIRDPPSTFDWRKQLNGQVVSPVKDQAQCGSCWAFSTTENFESMYNIAHQPTESIVLAPQQLVDCDPQSQGCGGGWTYWAWEYLTNAGGQELETSYPYKAVNQPCKFQSGQIAAKIKDDSKGQGYKYAIPACKQGPCTNQDENAMRAALVATGPFSVCVNAQTWNDYQGGVIQGSDCSGDAGGIDHCVQVVGYDWDQGYWMVRNSWNTNWGDNGYIYLQTGTNTCAVADVVTYGLVA